MSVISTAMKFDVTNCATAKVAPATSAIGQVSRTPRRPSTRKTRTNGTRTAMKGVWRPAIWESWLMSRPVTALRVMIGAAMAPNATGAVLASSETTAAFIGAIPAAISIAAEIATGAPKPASDSSRAPKENAIRIDRTRWSSDTARIRSPSTSNHPVTTVSRYTHSALIRIHRMGKTP